MSWPEVFGVVFLALVALAAMWVSIHEARLDAREHREWMEGVRKSRERPPGNLWTGK